MEMHGKKFLGGLLALVLMATAASGAPERKPLRAYPSSALQQRIDQAKAGATVHIPPGVYHGSLKIQKQITLVGAGPGKTILDGDGADIVLLIDAAATVSRITVRDGNIGVELRGPTSILQDSIVARNRNIGVHCLSSGILFNNRIYGNQIGVAVNSRGPVLLHNTIAGNRAAGVWSWYAPGPALVNDLVTHNAMAVDAGAGSRPEIVNSVEWGHAKPSAGWSLGAPSYDDPLDGRLSLTEDSPLAEAVELSPLLRLRPGAPSAALYPVGHLGKRRAEVELDRSAARGFIRRSEPQLTYRLTPEPGVFRVEVAFSQPSFRLGSAESTTSIEVLKVWDTKGTVQLHADVRKDGALGVHVDALDPDAPVENRRYRMECEFVDAQAFRQEDGKLIFERLTSLENSEILAPEGWTLRKLPARSTEKGQVLAAEMRLRGAAAP